MFSVINWRRECVSVLRQKDRLAISLTAPLLLPFTEQAQQFSLSHWMKPDRSHTLCSGTLSPASVLLCLTPQPLLNYSHCIHIVCFEINKLQNVILCTVPACMHCEFTCLHMKSMYLSMYKNVSHLYCYINNCMVMLKMSKVYINIGIYKYKYIKANQIHVPNCQQDSKQFLMLVPGLFAFKLHQNRIDLCSM